MMPGKFTDFIPPTYSTEEANMDFLSYDAPPGPDKQYISAPKRRSWADVVDKCSEQNSERISTVTDISSLADSRCSSIQNTNLIGSDKRRSWVQLIEEAGQINDQKSGSTLIDTLPTLPLPYANPALHMMTVRGDGRLARVHLYNKNKKRISNENNARMNAESNSNRRESTSGSSKTSTMSEFILVPSKTALTPSTSSSNSVDGEDSRRFRHDFGKSKKTCWPWTRRPSRRTIFVMILTIALLLSTAIGGYAIRRFIIGRRTIYDFTFPAMEVGRNDRSSVTLRLMVNEPSLAEFHLKDAQDVKTIMNFDKKLVITRTLSDPNYCFISNLNESVFPTIDALKEAAQNALTKQHPISWTEDWNWKLEPIHENLRESIYFDDDSKWRCGKNLYWMQRSDMPSWKCLECWPVCLPSYGRRVDADPSRPTLTPVGRDCFWFSTSITGPSNSRPFVNNGYALYAPSFVGQQNLRTDTRQQYQQNGPAQIWSSYPNRNIYNPNQAWMNFASQNAFVSRT